MTIILTADFISRASTVYNTHSCYQPAMISLSNVIVTDMRSCVLTLTLTLTDTVQQAY
jgi:hypothetical protein